MKEFHSTNKEIRLAHNLEKMLIAGSFNTESTQCLPLLIKTNGIICTCSKCRYSEDDDGELYCRAWKGYRNKTDFCQLYVKKEDNENDD